MFLPQLGESWPYLRKNLAALQKRCRDEGLPVALYPGCEIACAAYVLEDVIEGIRSSAIRTMNGTDRVMLEFWPSVPPEELLHCVRRVLDETGKQVILAHVERYYNLAEPDAPLRTLLEWGCLFQINAYSLAEERSDSIRAFARRLLREQLVSFLGSDAHRTDHRPPALQGGVAYIRDNCSEEYALDVCCRNARRVLLGQMSSNSGEKQMPAPPVED